MIRKKTLRKTASLLLITSLLPISSYAEISSDHSSISSLNATSQQEVVKDAQELGRADAERDFSNGLPPDPDRSILSRSQIVTKYNLDSSNSSLVDGIVASFTNAYKVAYNDEYARLSMTPGQKQADILAKRHASEDFYKRLAPDKDRRGLSRDEIIARYYLDLHETSYREQFIIDFTQTYMRVYLEEYVRLDNESGKDQGEDVGREEAEALAKKHAEEDFLNRLDLDYERHAFSSEDDIVKAYNLNGRTHYYRKGFLTVFKATYREEYISEYMRIEKENGLSLGKSDALERAQALAKKHAEEDFSRGLVLDNESRRPSDSDLTLQYHLDKKNPSYKDEFLLWFGATYSDTYTKEYTLLAESNSEESYEKAKEDGVSLAKIAGSQRAQSDFLRGRSSDSRRAYSEFKEDKSLEARYFIHNESVGYRKAFEISFESEFYRSYSERYTELNMESSLNNVVSELITSSGGHISIDRSGLGNVSISIPKASFYSDTMISLAREKDSFDRYNSADMVPVSEIYSVSIDNKKNLSLRNDLTISFDYSGSDRVGIYELVDGRWSYLTTSHSADGSSVSAVVSKEASYNGGRYALFIDEEFKHLEDIQASWARDEIYTYLRRGYVAGDDDNKFNPETGITRGEFLELSSRVMGWNYEGLALRHSGQFKDREEFGEYEGAINYAVSRGYISGFEDSSFRPNSPLSYSEINEIMKKITTDLDFTWNYFSEKLLHEKFYSSSSRVDMDKPISKSEAVFMYYDLEKSRRSSTVHLELGSSHGLLGDILLDEDVDRNGLTWRTDNSAVASIDGSGNVRALSPGTAKIQAVKDDGTVILSRLISVRNTYKHHEKWSLKNDFPVPLHKQWTVQFSQALDASPENLEGVYVSDRHGFRLDGIRVSLSDDSKSIVVTPTKPYVAGDYYLNIEGLVSASGTKLNQNTRMRFLAR